MTEQIWSFRWFVPSLTSFSSRQRPNLIKWARSIKASVGLQVAVNRRCAGAPRHPCHYGSLAGTASGLRYCTKHKNGPSSAPKMLNATRQRAAVGLLMALRQPGGRPKSKVYFPIMFIWSLFFEAIVEAQIYTRPEAADCYTGERVGERASVQTGSGASRTIFPFRDQWPRHCPIAASLAAVLTRTGLRVKMICSALAATWATSARVQHRVMSNWQHSLGYPYESQSC
ncbi:hypothetical protein V8F33_006791 [Rhypophila sp. PSN 637]